MNRGKAKVTFLSTSPAYGGAETHPVRLATQLKARGWNPSIMWIRPAVAFAEELEGSYQQRGREMELRPRRAS